MSSAEAQFRNGTIEKIDLDKKEVHFSRGLDGKQFQVTFDHLFLNLGSVENFSLFPGIREHTLRLKSYPDILQTRHHLIVMLELADIEEDPIEVERLLNFVVAGGNTPKSKLQASLRIFATTARKRFPNIPRRQIRGQLDSLRRSYFARTGQPVSKAARLCGAPRHGQSAHSPHDENTARIRDAGRSGTQYGRANS